MYNLRPKQTHKQADREKQTTDNGNEPPVARWQESVGTHDGPVGTPLGVPPARGSFPPLILDRPGKHPSHVSVHVLQPPCNPLHVTRSVRLHIPENEPAHLRSPVFPPPPPSSCVHGGISPPAGISPVCHGKAFIPLERGPGPAGSPEHYWSTPKTHPKCQPLTPPPPRHSL